MKNKCNKIKQTCGSSTYAACVEYEGTPNEVSPLLDNCALSVEEVLGDIYNQLEEINLSELAESCLEYIETAEGKIVVKNVLLKFEEEICLLKEKILALETTDICDKNLTTCNLDFGNLVPECGGSVTTLGDTLQLILDNLQTP